MRKILVAALACTSLIAVPLSAVAQQSAADEVMAVVKAQWAVQIQDPTNVAEAMKNVASDYTLFSGDYSTRLDGKPLNQQLNEMNAKSSSRLVAAEMANPKVQVYGEVAVLTYNFVGITQDKDGETHPQRAKSTRVYVKQGGKWMLVHANFGIDPQPD